MLRCRRVKMAEKSERNGKESGQQRLVKQRKHYLTLARKSFRNQKNMKQKREAGNICQKLEGICPKLKG